MIKSSLSRVALGTYSVLGLLVGAAMPAAACEQWLAPAQMEVIQGLNTRINFLVIQRGTRIDGFAEYYGPHGKVIGNYGGTIVGDVFYARVLWTYSGVSAIGRYTGKITPRVGVPAGEITYGVVNEGYTYDEYNPKNKANWSATHFICQDVEPPPPPAPPDFKEEIDKEKHDAMNAAFETAAPQPPPPKALGRIQPRAETPVGPPTTMCEKAAAARAANRPTAAALQQRCDAERAAQPPAEPVPTAPLPADPVPTTQPPVDPTQLDALAATGAEIAQLDPAVAEARASVADADYQRGFDIATGIFGDPALGALGSALTGSGAASIRDSLSAAGQGGFDASAKFHVARTY